ncbi:YjaG family protein [Planctobacterium marinum]|uniref:YjaG family protein n=1 Tax=Planctobacterium marinum TaxID=1631968 RepID=UPI001E565EA5|nr:YjaG family protein [Planctobacterium marinum]MCC2606640.1 YjaG family protein [Planctobacterium marinum]
MAKLTIFQQVREFNDWRASAFALTLLERMYPNYHLFCELTGFYDAEQLRHTLNSLWDWLGSPKTKINFESQRLKLDEATPDINNFDNYGVYPALDFAVSLDSVLNLISGEDAQGAVVVSKVSQGCVEAYIEASEGEQEDIKQHPLMSWEIAFQAELIALLQGKIKRNNDLVKRLKALAVEEGISNIGLEIV